MTNRDRLLCLRKDLKSKFFFFSINYSYPRFQFRSERRDPKLNVFIHDAFSPLSVIRKNIHIRVKNVAYKDTFLSGLKHRFKYLSKNKKMR